MKTSQQYQAMVNVSPVFMKFVKASKRFWAIVHIGVAHWARLSGLSAGHMLALNVRGMQR